MAGLPGRAVTIVPLEGPPFVLAARTKTLRIDNAPVDITTDDADGWRDLLLNEPSQQTADLTVEGTLVSSRFLNLMMARQGLLFTLSIGVGSTRLIQPFLLVSLEVRGEYRGTVTYRADFQSADAPIDSLVDIFPPGESVWVRRPGIVRVDVIGIGPGGAGAGGGWSGASTARSGTGGGGGGFFSFSLDPTVVGATENVFVGSTGVPGPALIANVDGGGQGIAGTGGTATTFGVWGVANPGEPGVPFTGSGTGKRARGGTAAIAAGPSATNKYIETGGESGQLEGDLLPPGNTTFAGGGGAAGADDFAQAGGTVAQGPYGGRGGNGGVTAVGNDALPGEAGSDYGGGGGGGAAAQYTTGNLSPRSSAGQLGGRGVVVAISRLF